MAKNKQIFSLFSSTLLWRKEQTDSLFYDNNNILLLSGLVGAVNFKGNPNDEEILEKNERITKTRAKNAYVDRGYRRKWIGQTKINAPDNGQGKSQYDKAKARRCFRRRAAIEPIIGHAKENYGMRRNHLKGEVGDAIKAMLAASAFNFKSWMRKATAEAIFALIYIKTKWQKITIQSKLMPSFGIPKERLFRQTWKKNLTETVRNFREFMPEYFPLVYRSPRNRIWQKKNPWFESDVIPFIQKVIKDAI